MVAAAGAEDEDVRKIDENVGSEGNLLQMGNEIHGDVDEVPGSEHVEIDARTPRGSQRANDGKCARAEMAEVHDAGHVKEAEHEAVRVHDARHVIEKIDAEKQGRKPPRTPLDGRYLFGHVKPPEAWPRIVSRILFVEATSSN